MDNSKLTQLRVLLDSGRFHHATYRDHGKLWEGLHIYERDDNGFNGYKMAGFSFLKNDPELDLAYEMLRHTGVSVGSYGRG